MEARQDKALLSALECMPPDAAAALLPLCGGQAVEEVRLRAGLPPAIKQAGRETALPLPPIAPALLRETLARAARYSLHSYQDSLRQGFVTLAGGHRLGVCGTAASENGQVIGIRTLSSLCLRVARQVDGLGTDIALRRDGVLQSTLLLSPPGFGKTTLLRALIRRVSDEGTSVGAADERGELAALSDGQPQLCVGRCTDVIEGCPKREAALMLLKTMSPALLALDEITAPQDVEAVRLCAHCGVAVLAGAHARDTDDLHRRPLYRALLQLGVFTQAVVIGIDSAGRRTYTAERLEGASC